MEHKPKLIGGKVFKRKTLDDKVAEYRMTFGKHKDELLDDTPVEYMDWALNNYDRLTDWDRKVLNRYIHLRAVEINERAADAMEEHDKAMEQTDSQNDDVMAWVDENF